MRLLRRMPAVSTKRMGPSSVSTSVSMLSRVVPGRSCTTDRSSPISLLNSVDLPTFGRPTMATAGGRSSSSIGAGSGAASSAGRAATTRSRRSPTPRPCRALTGAGSPRPRRVKSQASESLLSPSTLLATNTTGRLLRRSRFATRSSSSVTPTVASTTSRTRSASATARSAWSLTWLSSPPSAASQPPVSTRRNGRPRQSASTVLRSRVTPGCSSTIASRRPRMRLTSVDLPTLGRPTTATTGAISAPEGPPQRHAVGGHDLDRAGQLLGAGAVEEHAAGQADVGQEIAVPFRLVRQGPGQVLAHQQAGHGDVAAEELVAHRDHAHVGLPQAVDERPEDAGAVLPGQHRRRCVCAITGVIATPIAQTGDAGRSVALGRRAVDPCEEARLHAGAVFSVAHQLALEGAGDADTVLVLGEALVGAGLGEGAPGQQVVLVGGEDEAAAEDGEEQV